jgi:hypothetical protein
VSAPIAKAVTVTTGNIAITIGSPTPNETHIFLDATTGTTVFGHPGAQPATPIITFTSPAPVDAKNGFSSVDAIGGGQAVFHSLTVAVPTGFLFTDLIFGALGVTDIAITAFNNASIVGTYSNTSLANGLNQFLVQTVGPAAFTSLLLSSTSGFSHLKQFEISGLAPSAVPLPGALVLFGTVLMGGIGLADGAGVVAERRSPASHSGSVGSMLSLKAKSTV